MFLSGSLSNVNIIQPLPRFYTLRFGRRTKIDVDDDDQKNSEYKIKEINQPIIKCTNEDITSSILLTGIRNRDWIFYDDPRNIDEKTIPKFNYQLIPSINNTIKNRSILNSLNIDQNENHYEEYDLDEQDLQWLIDYNQFRIEKNLSELDENIFEYIMQLFEHQCLIGIRQKNYEDTIQCDACHRIDDVDDLIQCIQCKTIVHKKCYGLEDNQYEWICYSCKDDNDVHRCFICDKTGGGLKSFKSSLDEQPMNKWIHLSCAFWISQFEFDEKMRPILKDSLSYDGQCSICCKTIGFKQNCCWKNCQERFHAKCAIEAGQDMLIAENDDQNLIYLLALCNQHTEKFDLSEKQIQMNKFLDIKQKRFENFASYINLDIIKNQTLILPDILECIHTYWLLKRQTNHGRPLIDLPDDIFYHDYEKKIDLKEFSRQYHLDHQDQTTDFFEDKSNVLQFLTTNRIRTSLLNNNLFIKYARRYRKYFINYERNCFCLLDAEKKKR